MAPATTGPVFSEIKWMDQPCQQQQGGGGTIIIRNAIKATLEDPVIHGMLPPEDQAVVDPILAKDVNDWTAEEQHLTAKAFFWVAVNC